MAVHKELEGAEKACQELKKAINRIREEIQSSSPDLSNDQTEKLLLIEDAAKVLEALEEMIQVIFTSRTQNSTPSTFGMINSDAVAKVVWKIQGIVRHISIMRGPVEYQNMVLKIENCNLQLELQKTVNTQLQQEQVAQALKIDAISKKLDVVTKDYENSLKWNIFYELISLFEDMLWNAHGDPSRRKCGLSYVKDAKDSTIREAMENGLNISPTYFDNLSSFAEELKKARRPYGHAYKYFKWTEADFEKQAPTILDQADIPYFKFILNYAVTKVKNTSFSQHPILALYSYLHIPIPPQVLELDGN